jgi:hypothetical protein
MLAWHVVTAALKQPSQGKLKRALVSRTFSGFPMAGKPHSCIVGIAFRTAASKQVEQQLASNRIFDKGTLIR